MSVQKRWAGELGVALRVAARYQRAFEFPTPQALKEYLKDHPGADPAKHTVAKPKDHEKGEPEAEGGKGEKKEHGEGKGKPKTTWKDVMKGLSSKAVSFVKSAPEQVKKFVQDEGFRRETLMKAHKAITDAPEKLVEKGWHAAKEEIHEFKEAGEGVSAWMHGKQPSKHQKEAMRKVAVHVALSVTAGALSAGIGASAGIIGKGVLGSFLNSTAKKIAVKAVIKRLEHLPAFEELAHVAHHGAELFSEFLKIADDKSKDADPDKVFQMLIAAAVAKELKELEPETLVEALEDAAGSD